MNGIATHVCGVINITHQKWAVVIFDNSKPKAKKHRHDLNLGTSPLAESDNYEHLGVICDHRSMTSPCVKECCDKIRGTLFCRVNYGFNDDGLQPMTCKHI